ncbi:glycosyl hydrolase family 28 protein [Paenibacillus sp. MMS20-IR301]|uniref:glycosyl hydrolase family 28 protein n=1 Tax=Paenibacillus sp. MMS20-IR301 TaxID=2895946 RepID=UPI0028EF73D5|nr:glycosyl hydrolase family 28 protein [Paenibacillus sp. MMS20-IR301]WNS43107.1 glycosyl hydrolase family 28 protein [Paenibacillus sp. MMS20-IR301]
MNQLIVYDAPKGAPQRQDFKVRVRLPDGAWQELFVYEAKVDMHEVRRASMAYFDMSGTVFVEVEYTGPAVEDAVIRPLSAGMAFTRDGNVLAFALDRPCKLSVEVNGDRFGNLHLFANPLETDAPRPEDEGVLLLKPAIHRTADIYRKLKAGEAPKIIYFGPGMHYIEETLLRIPSDTTVYIAGGAVVAGSLVCERAENVVIRGRGVLYLGDYHRFSAFRGIRIEFSKRISVEGLILLDPPHYSIYIGKSEFVLIENFKSFSTRGWSDGIDMMASSDIEIRDVFLRTSDDCIAIYGSRWDYRGDTRRVRVSDSILWADVAHPLMMGTHGDHDRDGDTIEEITFSNIDILEHHEPQPDYWGAMAINAGDKNRVRQVTYEDIRVEAFELGQLIDIRVVWNKDYNPVPGGAISGIVFRRIRYTGANMNPNRIHGYDPERPVDGVRFEDLEINGQPVTDAAQGNFDINEYAVNITFAATEDEQ